jgi:negative regulator of genetic competence, sporulation and motility
MKEPDPIESNDFYFSGARRYFSAESLDEIKEENKLDHKGAMSDEIWEYKEKMFIPGCTKNECKEIDELDEAKELCLAESDCMGVIESFGKYQLRCGRTAKESKHENSWIRKYENCSEVEMDGVYLDVKKLEAEKTELKESKEMRNGKCEYSFGYSHINDLIRFNKNMKPDVLQQPDECSFIKEDRDSILFGIKTIPSANAFRQAIRESWLSDVIWDWLGFEIKVKLIKFTCKLFKDCFRYWKTR